LANKERHKTTDITELVSDLVSLTKVVCLAFSFTMEYLFEKILTCSLSLTLSTCELEIHVYIHRFVQFN